MSMLYKLVISPTSNRYVSGSIPISQTYFLIHPGKSSNENENENENNAVVYISLNIQLFVFDKDRHTYNRVIFNFITGCTLTT